MQHKLHRYELSSGARLAIVQVPGAVSSYLGSYVRSGVAFVPRHLHELSHLLEHLAFEGTKTYPQPLDFKQEVERNGAYFNAYTGQYLNWYEMVGEEGEAERLLPLAVSQLYEPAYELDRIRQQQETVLNELQRNAENDSRRLGHYANKLVTPSWRPEFKERMEMTKKIQREDLLAFHSAHYALENTDFLIGGDFNSSKQREIIMNLEKLLEGVPRGKRLKIPEPPYAQNFGGVAKGYKPYRQNQSAFMLRAHLLRRDMTMAVALRLLATMYTSGLSSRMNIKAREAGLTYAIGSFSSSDIYDTEFMVSSETRIDKLRALVELSLNELTDLIGGGFNDDELTRAKSFASGQLRRSLETPTSLARWYGDDLAMGMDVITPDEWVKRLQDVTRNDILEASQELFERNRITLTLIGAGLEDDVGDYTQLLQSAFK